jgi:hypothetical protein
MITELVRTTAATTGIHQAKNVGATWNRDAGLGFVTPLVLVSGVAAASNVIVAGAGINSYMLLCDVAVGVAGALSVNVAIVRPDTTTLWPVIGVGNVPIAAAGWNLLTFGSRGRDQLTQPQGFASLLFVLSLIKTGAGNVTLNNIRLQSMTRP